MKNSEGERRAQEMEKRTLPTDRQPMVTGWPIILMNRTKDRADARFSFGFHSRNIESGTIFSPF